MSSSAENNGLLITNSLLISQEDNNGNTQTDDHSRAHEASDIIVSQCDSSLEEILKTKASDKVILPIPSHKNQEGIEPTNNSNKCMDSSDHDILYLGLDCTPIPSPASEDQVGSISLSDSPQTEVVVTSLSDDQNKNSTEVDIDNKFVSNNLKDSKSDVIPCRPTDQSIGLDIDKVVVYDIETPRKSPQLVDNDSKTVNCGSVAHHSDKSVVISTKEIMCETKSEVSYCDLTSYVQTMDCETQIDTEKPGASNENESIFSSTPVSLQTFQTQLKSDLGTENGFGQMSPLDTSHVISKKNLKRKQLILECIEEVDEDTVDNGIEKKLKLIDTGISRENEDSKAVNEASAIPCFEPPAKSILKKWQSSFLTRSSVSGSFLVLDECGESDLEDHTKQLSEEALDPTLTDDFEVACKSLTEELIKSSSNVGIQEKYCSRLQRESQHDDDMFDEFVDELEQELTLNYDLDDKTSLSEKPMEEIVLNDREMTLKYKPAEDSKMDETIKLDEVCEDKALLLNPDKTASREQNLAITRDVLFGEIKSSDKVTLKSIDPKGSINDDVLSNVTVTVKVKTEDQTEISNSNETEIPECSNARSTSGQTTINPENLSIVYADGKDMTLDEEDFLLEEDVSSKKKPYVFFEYVSSDPKENEDNYNPEWQKLGKLTSDEERYKAVRDRWRSLVPPDPNRDLTCRQWREKNKKPPLNISSLNNNHHMHEDNERNQLCTAVFEKKIRDIQQNLEDRWRNIVDQRNMAFEDLALAQDEQQRMLVMRGGNGVDLIIMRKHHLEECRKLKSQYDQKLKGITRDAEDKVRVLKECSEEVLLFQKFYKGVGSHDDEVCLYLTDTQVQELMETEDMLEQYAKFYQ